MDKTPKGIRIAEIVLGIITIALSGFVIVNPDVTTLLFVIFFGVALFLTGISRIIIGIFAKQVSKGFKGISIGTGVISVIGGIFALVNPIATIATVILIISIFILVHGLGLVASGVAIKGLNKGSRISGIILGIIAVIFASIIFAYPGLALVMTVVFLSIGLLINGIASIVSGITGNRLRATKVE